MTKEEALDTVKLLSALESWGFTVKENFPDYLRDDLHDVQDVLKRIILEETQEKYTYGTPLLDAMTNKEKNT
jgi:hypothetical protein